MEQLLSLLELNSGAKLPTLTSKMFLEILSAAWAAVKVGMIIGVCYLVVIEAKAYHESFPVPMKIHKEVTVPTLSKAEIERLRIVNALNYLKCPKEKVVQLSEAILKAAIAIRVRPELILAILYTESRFNGKALSPKGYEGYMQTPTSTNGEYADVDILYGARILEEKMQSPLAKSGGLRTAIALYKGGLSGQAFSQADEVLRLYSKLKNLKGEPQNG